MKDIAEKIELLAVFMGYKANREIFQFVSRENFETHGGSATYHFSLLQYDSDSNKDFCERHDIEHIIALPAFRYNVSWDSIMKVVEKIKKFNTDGERYSTVLEISNSHTKIFVPKQELLLSSFETTKNSDDMLQNTFEACVEFVKWYNEKYN